MKILVYTFRTFPEINMLETLSGNVFVFGKLKEDLSEFQKILEQNKPDLVLGIASAETSRIEPVAINKFNSGSIEPDGPKEIRLFIPKEIRLPVAPRPTFTFCNWTMYRVGKYILDQKLKTKLSFVHVRVSDLSQLSNLL